MDFELPIGTVLEKEYTVTEEMTAQFLQSGDVSVLATPSMILLMEQVSRISASNHLPSEYTTVGVKVCIEHLNAAPTGAVVKVRSELIKQEGRRLTYDVKVYWNDLLLGKGTHERFIVNYKRFMKKQEELKKKFNL